MNPCSSNPRGSRVTYIIAIKWIRFHIAPDVFRDLNVWFPRTPCSSLQTQACFLRHPPPCSAVSTAGEGTGFPGCTWMTQSWGRMRCWLRWVSCYFMSEAPGELPPQPKTQKLRISRRQDWGSAYYFQYFRSLEYTHLINIEEETSTLHTCTLGVRVLTTQTHGEKIRKDLITALLKRVSPP